MLLAFAAVPAAIYLLSYVEFFVQHPFDVAGFGRLQWHMFTAQMHVAPLPQNSPAWSWPLLLHPIRYWPDPASGFPLTRGTIVAVGNVALFWGFLLALPFLVQRCMAKDAWGLRLLLAFYGVMLLPWLAVSRPQFIVYVLPCVPFMALAMAALLRGVGSRAVRRAGAGEVLRARGVTVGHIRRFVERLLGSPSYAEAAERLDSAHVSRVVVWLASEAATGVTGRVVRVEGEWVLTMAVERSAAVPFARIGELLCG